MRRKKGLTRVTIKTQTSTTVRLPKNTLTTLAILQASSIHFPVGDGQLACKDTEGHPRGKGCVLADGHWENDACL